MRGLLFITAILAANPEPSRIDREFRVERGYDRASGGPAYAYLEFAPASGAGMGTACACASVTGAKGETVVVVQPAVTTCTKTAAGGLSTSGIADGDLVACSGGQPRVEYDSAGVLGLLVEKPTSNVLLRSDAPSNAAWSDVGTPGLTTGQTDPFGTTNGVTFDDNDAAAYEGRSQAVTVSAGAAYTMSCYLKAGTATTATLSLDGTTAAFTGLSTTTWTLTKVTDASSSGASISAQVLVGNATADTGTIVYGGCQVEAGTYATSYIPTTAVSAARNGDDVSLTVTLPSLASFSMRGYFDAPNVSAVPRLHGALKKDGTNFVDSYTNSGVWQAEFSSTAGSIDSFPTGISPGLTGSVASYWDGSIIAGCVDGVCYAQAASGFDLAAFTGSVTVQVGAYTSTNGTADGIVSRLCLDPDPMRCR